MPDAGGEITVAGELTEEQAVRLCEALVQNGIQPYQTGYHHTETEIRYVVATALVDHIIVDGLVRSGLLRQLGITKF